MGTGFMDRGAFQAARAGGRGVGTEMPGRAEYLLVIYPGGELLEQLLEEQVQFSREYGLPPATKNRPHITIAAFHATEDMEDTLIRWLRRICNGQERFSVMLNNYSGFPPHTIYLRVQDPLPFRQLMGSLQAIDEFVRSNGAPPASLFGKPYLSIAGGLTEQVYNKAMPEYSRRTFNGSFRVDELILLKRNHPFDPCKTVNIFHLLPELRAVSE